MYRGPGSSIVLAVIENKATLLQKKRKTANDETLVSQKEHNTEHNTEVLLSDRAPRIEPMSDF